ncbi:PNDC1-like protein [Mya arenaria]|uniref:PNDC1-like protein n=1 Tax=Mya arenaria TaxID=6604 RepID=A0ABY7E073_MYAAR|nr:PNDC1-like protein [Mya arenaria]
MVEILSSSFDEKFAEIEQAIRSCDYIAIDTEFTGLRLNEQVKSSLYTAKTFNIPIYPRSFGPIDEKFVCQASSFQFLTRYKFDFNKFVYEGVSFLNEVQEREVREHIANLDEFAIQKICSRVADWLVSKEEEKTFTLKQTETEGMPMYVLSMELRGRFPSIWTTIDNDGKLISIERIGLEERQRFEEAEKALQWKQEEQLPLLGHNMLMDLMLMYDKFHRPLPVSYSEFKATLHAFFPWIYDTKHVALRLRGKLEESGLLQNTSLSELYTDIERSSDVIPCMFRRYLQAMEDYCNRINIIRARVNNINLDGADYKSQKPEFLFVKSRFMKKRLNIDQLAKWFSPYGNVDLKLYGKNQALAATNSFKCSKDILKAFKQHNSIFVTNIFTHFKLKFIVKKDDEIE